MGPTPTVTPTPVEQRLFVMVARSPHCTVMSLAVASREDLQQHQEFTYEQTRQGSTVHDLGILLLSKMIVMIALLSGSTAAKNALKTRLE